MIYVYQYSWRYPFAATVVKDFAAGFDCCSFGDRVIEVILND
jgi:hypothetical protein